MKNVAYTEEYKNIWSRSMVLFKVENFTESEEHSISKNYKIIIDNYRGKVEDYNYSGCKCSLVDREEQKIIAWYSIDDSGDFYNLINHSDGKEYLVFRQDLYGYSVLDIKDRKIFQFYPEKSLNGGETFIWTGVNYNPLNNLLIVSGCYWGAPNSVEIYSFENPMADKQKSIDLAEIIDKDYEVYEDIDFKEWLKNDIQLKVFAVETEKYEDFILKEGVYKKYLD